MNNTSHQVVINTEYFYKRFPTEESAVEYLETKRWNGKPVCPFCNSTNTSIWNKKRPGWHRCNNHKCRKQFNAKSGSIFEHSRIKLQKWFLACYYILRGFPSTCLSHELKVTQKTAWRMGHCIREAMGSSKEGLMLKGIVEIDETYLGGKERKKHLKKRLFPSGGNGGKKGVLGMVERGEHGKVISIALPDQLTKNFAGKIIPTPDTSKELLQSIIMRYIKQGSFINTDCNRSYNDLRKLGYMHWKVDHSKHKYVIDLKHPIVKQAHTNTIESRWRCVKDEYRRHHWFSKKHAQRYLDESDFRWNEAKVFTEGKDRIVRLSRMPTESAFEAFISGCFGKQLKYKELIS